MQAYARKALNNVRYCPPLNRAGRWILKAVRNATGAELPYIVKHLHPAGEISSRLPNGRQLRLFSRGGDDGITNIVFWNEWCGYEPESAPLFWRIASHCKVVLDIGAHVGFYSVLARSEEH